MATARKRRFVPVPEMTAEETWRDFDDYARSRVGMSGTEFIHKYDAGEIDVDDPEFHIRYIHLEMLLPFVRDLAPKA